MKTDLKLSKPIWNKAQRKKRMSGVIFQSALELEGDIKDVITSSRPAGRTYPIGAITSSRKTGLNLGTRTTASGKRLNIIGYKLHRASAKGQPPAIRTGGLINSIRTKPLSPLRVRVFVGKNYGGVLDAKNGLDRPFFAVTVRRFKPKYLKRIRTEYKKLYE